MRYFCRFAVAESLASFLSSLCVESTLELNGDESVDDEGDAGGDDLVKLYISVGLYW